MARDYFAAFDVRIKPALLARALGDAFSLSGSPAKIQRGRYIGVSVFSADDAEDRVVVAFRLDKFDPQDAAADEMFTLLVWLLANLRSPRGLTDDDYSDLLRRDESGNITLIDSDGF
jgi:hypothetical protein